MEPQKSPYIRDVKLPGVESTPNPINSDPRVKTTLVNNIPVVMQGGVPAPAPQPAPVNQNPGHGPTNANHSVGKQPAKPGGKKPGPKPPKTRNSQALPIAIAVIVALVLAFIAYNAFKNSGGA